MLSPEQMGEHDNPNNFFNSLNQSGCFPQYIPANLIFDFRFNYSLCHRATKEKDPIIPYQKGLG
jgi:hypothetical protein